MARSPSAPAEVPAERIALVDLLDRVLAEGVVVTGEITLSVADVDLVTISLRALLASVSALTGPTAPTGAAPTGGADDSAHPVPSRRG
jgi:Gas vesicle protein